MATKTTPRRRSQTSSSAMLKALGEREAWLREQAGLTAASRAQTLRDLEDLGRREEDTQRDYLGRYPIELLQNAHDACADAGVKGTVAFVLTDEALIVANQGKPFDARRVRSLVRQGMSDKARRRRKRTIGYKGVGFSAVFEASESPQIISAAGPAFGFDRGRAKALVEEHIRKHPQTVAARNFPFRLSPGDWAADAEVLGRLFERGFVTAIRLPLRPSVTTDDVVKLLDEQIHAEALVFLPSVRRIEIHRDHRVRAHESSSGVRVGIGHVVHVDHVVDGRRQRASWLTHAGTVPVTPEEIEGLDDPAWADVAELKATIALPWANRTIAVASSPTPIHLYFPTAETTGRACLIHGDFHVDSGRSHIFDKGPGGHLNRKLAAAVSEFVADLAESVAARHGAGLLAALAPTGTPSAFGEVLNEHLDARLSVARIVRSTEDSTPRRPNEMKFVSDREAALDESLMALMTKRADLVRVGDYQAGGVVRLLEALGVKSLTSAQTAQRVTVARASLSYEKALALLGDWIDEKGSHVAAAIVEALSERRILKDANGGWCRPADAVLSIDGVPPMPTALRRVELKPVRAGGARRLLEALDVHALGPAEALASINNALDKQTFGESDADKQELHDWLLALFRANPDALKHRWPLKSRAPVRARDGNGTIEKWTRATAVYFGRGWSDIGGHMEVVYGDSEPRFLAGDGGAASKSLKEFYAALGVQRLPRLQRPVSPHAGHALEWRRSAAVRGKAACPDGHTHSDQTLACRVLDRLDPILARAQGDPVVAEAFNELLAALARPYGEDATFTCENVNHRNKAKPRVVPGYQRWRLRTTPWMLVVNDPAGRTHRAPTHVWSGIPRSQAALMLPRPKLSSAPSGFELVAWERPSAEAVEHALADLRDAFPDLHVASEAAQETADVLMHKLEVALDGDEPREPVFLPGTISGRRAWVDDGVVLDLPGLGAVPELPIVHIAPASRIRAAYRLEGAHERLDEQVLPGDRVERPPLLDRPRRAAVVALLGRRRSARRELARRVAAIDERQVARIDVEVALSDGRTHPLSDLPFKLVVAGAPPVLYLNDPALEHALDLAAVLADYLDVADETERLALALLSDELARRLHPSELAEAADLIDTLAEDFPAANADDVVPESGESGPSDVLAPQDGTPPVTVPPAVEPATDLSGGHRRAPVERPPSGLRPRGSSRSFRRLPDDRPDTSEAVGRTSLPDPVLARFGDPVPGIASDRLPSAPSGEMGDDVGGRRADLEDERDHGVQRPPRNRPDEFSEQDAVKYVWEYACRVLGVKQVLDRQKHHCGWDLEFIYPDGRVQLVEVKGSVGLGPFEITRNELEQSRTHAGKYVVYFLALQDTSRPVLLRFDDFGARVRSEHLSAASWVVGGWRDLAPVVIDVELPPG